ncbi:rhodanese-like domain-containing protein [Hydrotalea sp.]|uniref:rhodanese-like domain-containing protein n=1 Tax=Hydrotalea sp. TaxID=2881279 RepID=UPI002622282D|nr:rhodanese-like domain-containing protein [Hydrotalea sp.]
MLSFLKNFFSGKKVDYQELQNRGAIIIDVRTPAEFKTGHIRGAVNIPVDQIKIKTTELKKKNKPVITCCRSGARSGMAKSVLAAAGIEVYNGGAWFMLEKKL